MRTFALAAMAIIGLSQPSNAVTFHATKSSYDIAASDARAVVLPDIGGTAGVGGVVTADVLSFETYAPQILNSGTSGSFEWSTLLPGPDLTVSGKEDFSIRGERLKSLSFDIHEPTTDGSIFSNATDTCSHTCVQSRFRMSVFAAGVLLGFQDIDPVDNALTFFGVTSDVAFDAVIVNEIIGNPDNEFFGNFTVSQYPASPVPLPASIWFLMCGVGLLFRRRRSCN
jgi:hypothetical protein